MRWIREYSDGSEMEIREKKAYDLISDSYKQPDKIMEMLKKGEIKRVRVLGGFVKVEE